MAIDVKNNNTMKGYDTVDPYTPVDVVVEGIRWTFGPNFKQAVKDDSLSSKMNSFDSRVTLATNQDEDNNSVRT